MTHRHTIPAWIIYRSRENVPHKIGFKRCQKHLVPNVLDEVDHIFLEYP